MNSPKDSMNMHRSLSPDQVASEDHSGGDTRPAWVNWLKVATWFVGVMLLAWMAMPAASQDASADANNPISTDRENRPASVQAEANAPSTAPAPMEAREREDTAAVETGVVVRMLAKGFAVTLLAAVVSIVVGFLLSVPTGVLLNRTSGAAKNLARLAVDFLRGTPVLVQLYFVHYAVMMPLGALPITSAIFTLSINAAAYMSEVVRSGLMSVDPGQQYAGRALGLSRWQVFRLVVWPQAFRIALPPLMNSIVALIKDTALISVIGVAEVVRNARTLQSMTFKPGRYYLIVAVMFFCVTFPLMKLAGWLEKRIREKGFAR
jgi:His/Glu/Gln/Arg/opine family amino acid ABC transporter permease subunit